MVLRLSMEMYGYSVFIFMTFLLSKPRLGNLASAPSKFCASISSDVACAGEVQSEGSSGLDAEPSGGVLKALLLPSGESLPPECWEKPSTSV